MKKAIALLTVAAAVLAAAATAGVSALSGSVTADGSSTVGPLIFSIKSFSVTASTAAT